MSKTSQNAYHAQTAELAAAVLRGIPALTAIEMQHWIENPAELADFLRGLNCSVKPTTHLIDLDADPKSYNGWEVASHKKGGLLTDLSQIRLHLDPEQEGRMRIGGNELRGKLADKSPLNANTLDWIMEDPVRRVKAIEKATGIDWKKDALGNPRLIFFWGTVYLDSRDNCFVRYLCWDGVRWNSGCSWLDGTWGSQHPAAVAA